MISNREAGLGGEGSEPSLHRLRAIASHGDLEQRIELADTEELPPEIYEVLANTETREVIVLLARNRSMPRSVLETLAQRDPALDEIVDLNPNAAPTRKERVELWKHTQVSLERYFDEMELGLAARSHILQAWMLRSARPLGDVRSEVAD